jgi:tetratricopeptide (TPR) repeat protein
LGRFEEALELFKCSIALFPEFMPSRVNMAACCGHLGLYEEGRKQYETVRKLAPTHVIGIFAQGGNVMVGLRKLQGID